MNQSDLRQFRAKHRLSQDELGEILGLRPGSMTRSTVSKYEHGILRLSSEDASKLYIWEAEQRKVTV
jgi:transcriptional regulator with XRE-family HTH domain